MEAKINGVASLIRDVFRMREKDIEDKYYNKHEELVNKVKKTQEYQKIQKQLDELEKVEKKLRKEQDKLTEHLGGVWEFRERALEKLKDEFIKVRITVMDKSAEEVKKIITEFSKKEFWEG